MEILIKSDIFKILKKEITTLKKLVLETEYDNFKDFTKNNWNMFYLQAMCFKPKNMKILKDKLLDNGIDEKYINNLLYKILKHDYKYENGIFSWNEIEEWNIDIDDVKKTTIDYTLI